KRESVGSWLHGVAYHLALKARAREARRRGREREAALMPKPATVESAWQELQEVLDRALHGLPEHHRAVLLLCYLDGKTQEGAAPWARCAAAWPAAARRCKTSSPGVAWRCRPRRW